MLPSIWLLSNRFLCIFQIFPSTARDAGIGLSYLIHFIFYNRQHSYYTIFYGQVENKMFSIILLICFPLGFLLTFLFMPETKDLPLTVTEDLGENLVLQPLQGLFAHEEEEIDDSYAWTMQRRQQFQLRSTFLHLRSEELSHKFKLA